MIVKKQTYHFESFYPNGTIEPINISRDKSGIQPLNFCPVNSPVGYLDPITSFAIETTKGKFILVNLYRFLYRSLTYNNVFNLTQWIINDDLSLSNITAEMILPNYAQFLPIATVDGDYMIIFTNSTNSINSSRDPYSPQGGIMAFTVNIKAISINYSGVGNVCLISLQPNSTTSSTSRFIKINFLSQGSLFNVTPTIMNSANGIMSLRFGGYFYHNTVDQPSTTSIWGYVLDDNGILHNWTLNYPTEINYYGLRQVLTNNTVVMVQPTIIHMNILITNTTPTIGQNNIAANKINFITITYAIPVALSDGTITIFQSNDGFGIVRQNVSGSDENYVKLSDNNTVRVEEPLYGLNNYVWNFKTAEEGNVSEPSKIQEWLLNSIDGKVKLTLDGTEYFDNLTRTNKQEGFFNRLTKELADALSIASVQITTTKRYQIDTKNIMIRNKPITALASDYISQYLDQTYGYVIIPKWYKDIGLMFQLILTGIFILGDDEIKRNHFQIYSYGFSILTFVLDILFAKMEAARLKIFFLQVCFLSKKSEGDSEKSSLILTEDLEDQREDLEGQREDSENQREDQREDSEGQREDSKSQRDKKKQELRIIIGEIISVIIKSIPELAIRVTFCSQAINFTYLSTLTLLNNYYKNPKFFTKSMELKEIKKKMKKK
ncbi:unnamed protein product [Rhizophagus irregularis]|nr:unnamed protein product [Rhizophagus irregularis]